MYWVDLAILGILQFFERPSSYASRTLIPSGPQSVTGAEEARFSMNNIHRKPGFFHPAPGGIMAILNNQSDSDLLFDVELLS
jgi:hypothetical protein